MRAEQILAPPLINSPFPVSDLHNLIIFLKPTQQPVHLIFGNSAQIHHIRLFDGFVFIDTGQNHLFLLHGIESRLAQ
jgi:hypothetical protein